MIKNFRKLFSANIISGVLGVITLTLVSRGLGPTVYGVAAVTISIGAFIEQVAGFQAWQAVTRYATQAQVEGDGQRFWRVVSLGLALDVFGCIVAASLGATVVVVFPSAMGLPEASAIVIALYMLSLAFAVSGTPVAVLRIYERYDTIGRVLIITAFVKLLLIVIASAFQLNLVNVLAIFALSMAGQHLFLVWVMMRLARREKGRIELASLRPIDIRSLPEFGSFIGSVYLSTTVRNISQELDTIILSAVSGPAIAGQYKLAKQYGSILLRAIDPAQQVIYPKFSTLVASKDFVPLMALCKRIMIFGAICSLIIYFLNIVFAEYIILKFLGDDFLLVPRFFSIFLIAILIFSTFFFLRPLVLSFGKPHAILAIYVAATLIFLIIYFTLKGSFGAYAMMIAQVGFYASWAIGMIWVSIKSWRASDLKQEGSA